MERTDAVQVSHPQGNPHARAGCSRRHTSHLLVSFARMHWPQGTPTLEELKLRYYELLIRFHEHHVRGPCMLSQQTAIATFVVTANRHRHFWA